MTDQQQEEQIPMQFVVEELQDTIRRRDNELLLANSRNRQKDDTIRSLQEQNVALQKRVNGYEAEGQNAVQPKPKTPA